jgi:hypothetical protein
MASFFRRRARTQRLPSWRLFRWCAQHGAVIVPRVAQRPQPICQGTISTQIQLRIYRWYMADASAVLSLDFGQVRIIQDNTSSKKLEKKFEKKPKSKR